MNAEQSNKIKEVNDSESKNSFPMGNPVAQTVQNGATASGQGTENFSESEENSIRDWWCSFPIY